MTSDKKITAGSGRYVVASLLTIALACCQYPTVNAPTGAAITNWVAVDNDTGLNWDHNWDTYFPQLAVLHGKLYAAWREMSADRGPMQIRVAVFNGDDNAPRWRFVDGNKARGLNWDAKQDAFDVKLAVFQEKLYAAWQEKGPVAAQIRVAVFNGNDDAADWSFVDGNGARGINRHAGFAASYPQFAVVDDKLYLAWNELNNLARQIRVAVFNGSDGRPGWIFVDGGGANGINRDPARNGIYPQLAALSSTLYAAWVENSDSAPQLRVARYNGADSAPAWDFMDGSHRDRGINRNPHAEANYPELAVHHAKLHIAWTERNKFAAQVRVAVFNGNERAPAWTPLDGDYSHGLNRSGRDMAFVPQLVSFNNRLYATWYEGEIGQIRVAVYNGDQNVPNWSFVDGDRDFGLNRNPRYSAVDPQMAVYDSKLYLTWKELIGRRGQRIHVSVGR